MSKEKRTGTIIRLSFEELGIDKGRYLQLKAECESGLYSQETLWQACQNMPDGVAAFILKSVTEGKSFERIEFDDKLGRICVCKTNFYALRRQFYSNLDKKLKERDAADRAQVCRIIE